MPCKFQERTKANATVVVRPKSRHGEPPILKNLSTAVAPGAIITIIGANSWRAFGGPSQLFGVIIVAALALVAVEYRNIPQNLRRAALILFSVSLVLLPFARTPLEAVQRGVFIAGMLLSLIASVTLIARCALRSKQVQIIGQSLRNQPPGRRYLAFNIAGQVFSAMLGFAGTNITLVMAAPADEQKGPQRTDRIVAVVRGFSAASFWSPMFGNMAILLALYPSLHWSEVFPVGLGVAQFTVIVGVLMNRRGRGTAQETAVEKNEELKLAAAAFPLAAVMLVFLSVVLTFSRTSGITITSSIVLLAPVAAFLLNVATGERSRRFADAHDKMRDDMMRFQTLASEAILFMAAGCAGSIMSDAFPIAWAQSIGHALDGTPFLGIGFLLTSIMLISLTGVPPVLSAVFLASTITPQLLALPPVLHMLAILTGWGLSAALTPFSVVSLVASRYSGTSLYYISIARNWAFVMISALLVCAALTGVALTMR